MLGNLVDVQMCLSEAGRVRYSSEVMKGHFDFGNFPTFSNPPSRGDGVQGPAIPGLGPRHDGLRYLIL